MLYIINQVALESAKILDDKACWELLADSALALGNHQVLLSHHTSKGLESFLSLSFFVDC